MLKKRKKCLTFKRQFDSYVYGEVAHEPKKWRGPHPLLNIFIIFAMVLYFDFARVAVSHLTGRKYDSAFRAQWVEQTTQFSLSGLGVGKREEQR